MRALPLGFWALSLVAAGCRDRKAPAPAATSTGSCATLPGDLVATTLGGRLAEAPRPFDGGSFRRCTYFLTAANGAARRVFVVYFAPAGDYDDLKTAHGGPVVEEAGLGDAAYRYRDSDTRRFWITALKRPRITLQVTGDSLAEVRKLTALALSRF